MTNYPQKQLIMYLTKFVHIRNIKFIIQIPQFRAQLFLYGIILGIDNCPYYRGFLKSKEIVVPLHFKFRAQTII